MINYKIDTLNPRTSFPRRRDSSQLHAGIADPMPSCPSCHLPKTAFNWNLSRQNWNFLEIWQHWVRRVFLKKMITLFTFLRMSFSLKSDKPLHPPQKILFSSVKICIFFYLWTKNPAKLILRTNVGTVRVPSVPVQIPAELPCTVG